MWQASCQSGPPAFSEIYPLCTLCAEYVTAQGGNIASPSKALHAREGTESRRAGCGLKPGGHQGIGGLGSGIRYHPEFAEFLLRVGEHRWDPMTEAGLARIKARGLAALAAEARAVSR